MQSQEGKSCKLIRVRTKPALWLSLTSTELLEFVAMVVVKVLLCELKTVTLLEPSTSGKGVLPYKQENIYQVKVCQKASESERNDTSLLRFKPCKYHFLSKYVQISSTQLSTMANNYNFSQLTSLSLREPPEDIYQQEPKMTGWKMGTVPHALLYPFHLAT